MAKLNVKPAIIKSENMTRSWTFFQNTGGRDAVVGVVAPAVLVAALACVSAAGVRCRSELVFDLGAGSELSLGDGCDALDGASWLRDALLFALVFERVIIGDKFFKLFWSSSESK